MVDEKKCNCNWLYEQEKMIASEYREMCKEYREIIEDLKKQIKEKDIQIDELNKRKNRPRMKAAE